MTTKIIRLQKLCGLLQSGERYLTPADLAERMEVSERTFYRDIKCLTDMGAEIDNQQGYRIRGKFSLLSQFTAEDVLNLQELIESSPLNQFPEHAENFRRLLAKVECALPDEQDEESAIRYSEPSMKDRMRVSLSDLDAACQKNRVCVLTYQSLEESQPSKRTVHPYAIVIRGGQWYLVAKDERKSEFRLYHLLRIYGLRDSDRGFERDENFDLERIFEHSWNVFQGPVQTVRLRVRGAAARLAIERLTPQRIRIERRDDETIVAFEVRGEREILMWALSQGENVEILAPESLREQACQVLSGALRQYEMD